MSVRQPMKGRALDCGRCADTASPPSPCSCLIYCGADRCTGTPRAESRPQDDHASRLLSGITRPKEGT